MWIVCTNTKMCLTKHWGFDNNAWIIWHFRATRDNVPDSIQKVIYLRITMSLKGQNKGSYLILDDFQEIHEDSMLFHHEKMIAIILHEFVPSTKVSEHVWILGVLFRYGGTILRSYSRESQMALFRHRFSSRWSHCEQVSTLPRSKFCACMLLQKTFFSHDL